MPGRPYEDNKPAALAKLVKSIRNDEECDATGDDRSAAAGNIKPNFLQWKDYGKKIIIRQSTH